MCLVGLRSCFFLKILRRASSQRSTPLVPYPTLFRFHQEVVTAFRQMLAAPEYRSRRRAFGAGPTLAKSQLMRARSGRDARCFEDVASAERWLFAPEARSPIGPPLKPFSYTSPVGLASPDAKLSGPRFTVRVPRSASPCEVRTLVV